MSWRRAVALTGAALVLSSTAASAHHTPKRDRVTWPKAPVTVHDLKARGIPFQRYVSLGRCEQPGNGYGGVRWQTPGSWTYQGGTGMYRGTHQSVGHPYSRNIGAERWQTQVLVASRVATRYGITAWGAWRCF